MASFESSKEYNERRAVINRLFAESKESESPSKGKGKKRKSDEKKDYTIACTKKLLETIRTREEYRGVGLALIPLVTGSTSITITDVCLPLFPGEKVKLETQDLVKFFEKYHVDKTPQSIFNAPKCLCDDDKGVQKLAAQQCPFQLKVTRVGVLNDRQKGACVYVANADIVAKKSKKSKKENKEQAEIVAEETIYFSEGLAESQ